MRGRKPVPEALARLHGRPGKRKARPAVDAKAPGKRAVARPPEWLSVRAQAKWRNLLPKLMAVRGLVSAIDLDALAAICAVWARMVEAERSLQDHGVMMKTPTRTVTKGSVTETTGGALVQSPMLAVFNRCVVELRALWAAFGMTPADRARLIRADGALPPGPLPPDGPNAQPPPGGPTDEFDAYLDQRPGRTLN